VASAQQSCGDWRETPGSDMIAGSLVSDCNGSFHNDKEISLLRYIGREIKKQHDNGRSSRQKRATTVQFI
jgi:hypothetical protein